MVTSLMSVPLISLTLAVIARPIPNRVSKISKPCSIRNLAASTIASCRKNCSQVKVSLDILSTRAIMKYMNIIITPMGMMELYSDRTAL